MGGPLVGRLWSPSSSPPCRIVGAYARAGHVLGGRARSEPRSPYGTWLLSSFELQHRACPRIDPWTMRFEGSQVAAHLGVWRMVHPKRGWELQATARPLPSAFPPLSWILYNKPANVFSWALWAVLTNHSSWRGTLGTFPFRLCSQVGQKRVTCGLGTSI